METTQVFEFKGQQIEFDLGREVIMVNATEMAKVFDKRVDVFMKSDHAKAFVEVLNRPPYGGCLGIKSEKDVYQLKGRSGAWMHRVLALKFAAWLDPEFEVWVYMTIDRLMFGDLRQMIAEKAKYDLELKKMKNKLAGESKGYQQLRLMEAKVNSLKSKIANVSKNSYQLFLQNEDLN